MVSRPTQKSSPAPRRTTISELSPAPSRSLVNSIAMASEAAFPICGRLSVISSTGPLRAVRMSLDMHFPPKALLRRSGNRAQKTHQLNRREWSAMPDPTPTPLDSRLRACPLPANLKVTKPGRPGFGRAAHRTRRASSASSPTEYGLAFERRRFPRRRAPHPLRGDRHLHVLDAEVLERVDDGVDHGSERRRGAAFAAGAHPERIVRRWYLADLGGKREKIARPRHGVIHERARKQLRAVAVVDAALVQGLADALRDRAVGLAVQDAGVDGAADVVDSGISDDLDRAQFEIDLDLADVAPVRTSADRHGLVAFGRQRSGQFVGQIVAAKCLARHVENVEGAVGAFDEEIAAGKFDVVFGGFERVSGDALAPRDQCVRRIADDDA